MTPMKPLSFLHHVFFFFLFTIVTHQQALTNPDLNSLISFKKSNTKNTILKSWSGSNPCIGWHGIKCDKQRVIGIYLHNASLEGSLTPLFEITQLRILSLKKNNLNSYLPQLNRFTNPNLRHLILSHNQINGVLNLSLPSLLSLRLEHNNLSGGLQALNLPVLRNFNVSNNNLLGEISQNLSKFPKSSFDGNLALCGSPLSYCANTSKLVSNSTAINESQSSPLINSYSTKGISKLGLVSLLAIGIGNLLLIAISFAIIISIYIWIRKKLSVLIKTSKNHHSTNQDEINNEQKEKRNGLVCFEGGEDLKLELLLKSSAEVLGKGITGSTYKAVLEDGIVVAVKRLSVVQFNLKNEKLGFDKYMGLIGKLRHENVVSLRGFFSTDEEKLLVYDFMPNGCLQSLLQSNGREGSTNYRTLNWSIRKQILFGAGHGLHYIHTYPVRPPLVHGNIKPSNILVNEDGTGCVSECGLMKFGSGTMYQSFRPSYYPSELCLAGTSSNCRGYKAPEILTNKGKVTQESDVYSFGMVLLELVTDKSLDETECEDEIMRVVKIGMICTAECPNDRPHMGQVLGMLSEFM
ncbi:hypothetical protein LUZ60_005241 [Juncus effusus]|nr:hypothetical protein LUZ60_005241 [Juncus effusus]